MTRAPTASRLLRVPTSLSSSQCAGAADVVQELGGLLVVAQRDVGAAVLVVVEDGDAAPVLDPVGVVDVGDVGERAVAVVAEQAVALVAVEAVARRG